MFETRDYTLIRALHVTVTFVKFSFTQNCRRRSVPAVINFIGSYYFFECPITKCNSFNSKQDASILSMS